MGRLFFGVILRVVHEKEAKENVFLESKSDATNMNFVGKKSLNLLI